VEAVSAWADKPEAGTLLAEMEAILCVEERGCPGGRERSFDNGVLYVEKFEKTLGRYLQYLN
jgi:hypothetical protein